MDRIVKILLPYLIILFGLFVLLLIQQPIVSGVCFLVGIVMIFERIWPEKWGDNNK